MSKWLLHFWTIKTRFCVEIALCRNYLCRSDWHSWHVMKFFDEVNGFIEGDIVKYYMLNRLTFKVGLYNNMFQWHFRGSRTMTRQFHDNHWLRIDLENHSSRLMWIPEDCYISIILNINPLNATHSPNAGLMLNHRTWSWPIISCNFSSPSRQHVVYAEVQDI